MCYRSEGLFKYYFSATYLGVAIVYFVLTFTLSRIVNLIESNMKNSNKKSISILSKKSRVKEIAQGENVMIKIKNIKKKFKEWKMLKR